MNGLKLLRIWLRTVVAEIFALKVGKFGFRGVNDPADMISALSLTSRKFIVSFYRTGISANTERKSFDRVPFNQTKRFQFCGSDQTSDIFLKFRDLK
jgi:hypothetical protein